MLEIKPLCFGSIAFRNSILYLRRSPHGVGNYQYNRNYEYLRSIDKAKGAIAHLYGAVALVWSVGFRKLRVIGVLITNSNWNYH